MDPTLHDIFNSPVFISLIRLCNDATLDHDLREAVIEQENLSLLLRLLQLTRNTLNELETISNSIERRKMELAEALSRILYLMILEGFEEYVQDIDHPLNPFQSISEGYTSPPPPPIPYVTRPNTNQRLFLVPREQESSSSSSFSHGSRQFPIDLVSPEPLPRMPTPTLMKQFTCFGCGLKGHFQSWCSGYKCPWCHRNRPMHYPSACPRKPRDSISPDGAH